MNHSVPIRSLLLLLCALRLIAPIPANAADTPPAWQAAQARALWADPHWLNLGHYQPLAWPDTWQSPADPSFFLAPDGATDPRAELHATLAAFNAPASQGDAHAQCRFPARLAWLREQLDLGALPQPACAAYTVYRQQVRADRTVLVFPSYYLNSPSSMFGHTLLRLDSTDADSPYLSHAVNFGAVVDATDNGMFFAFKGLTGGYPGRFEVDHYYKKIQEYNRGENRDIWEYPLNLSAQETERLIAHVWELQGINFAYYFFDENCSYRVLELLQVARPGIDLTSGFPLTAIPIDTLRAAQRAGLGQGKHYRPSQGSVLKQRLAALPPALHPLVYALSQSDDAASAVLTDARLTDLPAAQRAQVIEAAYKYLRYTQTNAARDDAIAKRSFALLRALQASADALPKVADDTLADPDQSPDLSHGSRRLSVGAWHQDGLNYLTLGLRLSLHSLEENRTGFPLGAQINLGNFDARLDQHGRVDVQQFDAVDITSLSPRNRFFAPLSWSVQTGVDRQWVDGREHRTPQVNGGVGAAYALGGNGLWYALGAARLEYNHGYQTRLQPGIGLRSGVLWDWQPLTLHAEAAVEHLANGDSRHRLELRQNLQLARQHALHLALRWQDRQPGDHLTLGLRYQFYY